MYWAEKLTETRIITIRRIVAEYMFKNAKKFLLWWDRNKPQQKEERCNSFNLYIKTYTGFGRVGQPNGAHGARSHIRLQMHFVSEEWLQAYGL